MYKLEQVQHRYQKLAPQSKQQVDRTTTAMVMIHRPHNITTSIGHLSTKQRFRPWFPSVPVDSVRFGNATLADDLPDDLTTLQTQILCIFIVAMLDRCTAIKTYANIKSGANGSHSTGSTNTSLPNASPAIWQHTESHRQPIGSKTWAKIDTDAVHMRHTYMSYHVPEGIAKGTRAILTPPSW